MRFIFTTLFLLLGILVTAQPNLHTIKVKKGKLAQFLAYTGENLPLISAHRGGRFYHGYPENSIPTFQKTIEKIPAMVEFDVRMTKDSVLILMHDRTLDRTTTGSGNVADQNWAAMKDLLLIDDHGDTTDFKIDTFEEVLKWGKKKVLLSIDVKRGVPFDKVVAAIEKHKLEDYSVVITYNLRDAKTVHELNPKLMLSVGIRNQEEVLAYQKAGINPSIMVAFTGTRQSAMSLYQSIHEMDVLCILGTMGKLDEEAKANGGATYTRLTKEGVDIIATDHPLEAGRVLRKQWPKKNTKLRYAKINY